MHSVVVPNSHKGRQSVSPKPLLSLRLFGLSVLLLASTLLFAGLLSSCRTSDPVGSNNNGEQPLVKTTIVGLVVDEAGKPVSGADVSAHGVTATSDKNGYFVLQNVNAPKDRYLAMAKRDGYFTGAKAATPVENGLTNVKLFMMPYGTRKSVSGATGGTVSVVGASGSASVKFEKDGLVTSGGAAYTGNAQVAIRHLDPDDASFAQYFAGDQAALRENGDRTDLISYGVLRVDIRSSNGEQLQPAAGKPAEITYPIPASMQKDAPASMPLWFFDEQKGFWVEEGVATKQGTNYVGTVKHFTDWNCDYPGDRATITGSVNCSGIPMPNVLIRIGQAYTYTGADGRFGRFVPAGVDITVVVDPKDNVGLFESTPITVPALTKNETRDIVVSLTGSCPSSIEGVLTDGQDQPIAGHVEWVGYGGVVSSVSTLDGKFTLRVTSNSSITFETSSWSCSGSKSFTVQSGDAGSTKDVGRFEVCAVGDPVAGDIDISTFGMPAYATLSPDGSKVLISGAAPVAVLRKTADGALLNTSNLGGGTYHYTAPPTFSSDGSRYSIFDYYQQQTLVFDAATGTKLAGIPVAAGVLMPDGTSVLGVTGDSNQPPPRIARFSVSTGDEIQAYALDLKPLGRLMIAGVSSDGKRAILYNEARIIVYDLENDALISNSEPVGYSISTYSNFSLSDDGNVLSVMGYSGQNYFSAIINTANGDLINQLPHLGGYAPAGISSDGSVAAVQDSLPDGTVLTPKLVKASDGSVIKLLDIDGEPTRFIYFSFSSDDKKLAGVYIKGQQMFVRLWDL